MKQVSIRKNLSLLAATFLLQLVVGCSIYGPDSPIPPGSETYIRFVSSSGTNVFDSLRILPDSAGRVAVKPEQMHVEIIRHRDGARVRMLTSEWIKGASYIREALGHDETVLFLNWGDLDFEKVGDGDRPYSYSDVYEIRLSSPLVFRSDETHVARWSFSVYGSGVTVNGCTVDDEAVRLDKDSIYIHSNDHPLFNDYYMSALLTVRCK